MWDQFLILKQELLVLGADGSKLDIELKCSGFSMNNPWKFFHLQKIFSTSSLLQLFTLLSPFFPEVSVPKYLQLLAGSAEGFEVTSLTSVIYRSILLFYFCIALFAVDKSRPWIKVMLP